MFVNYIFIFLYVVVYVIVCLCACLHRLYLHIVVCHHVSDSLYVCVCVCDDTCVAWQITGCLTNICVAMCRRR